ncbi:MAG: hypothetical protein IKS83_06750 [Victivallales bacterium]|nr:hypothetical protein [Victivallales bacterium]
MNCIERFQAIYHGDPTGVTFCPYRICPVGAHVDHQLGKVTGLALDCGIHLAYHPKQNGVVELTSLQFGKRAQFHVASTPEIKQGDWADYLRGATIQLGMKYRLRIGLAGVIEGSLPIGGLSSSAAVTIAFLMALAKVNDIHLSESEVIQFAKAAENKYVGVSCGTLDQSCEVYCRKNQLLYLDTKDGSYELIPQSPTMKPYRIAIFFSGLERALVSSKFNTRVDECRAAAYALLAYAGMDYGNIFETALRQVPREVFERYGERLPEPWLRRAKHYFTEYERAEQGVAAWRKGDIEEFGRISFASGRSSIELWEGGSPELKELYRIMTQTDGIYGGRFSGAGFKGCCMALIDPAFAESITRQATDEYLKAFPALKGKFSVHICDSADGVAAQL